MHGQQNIKKSFMKSRFLAPFMRKEAFDLALIIL